MRNNKSGLTTMLETYKKDEALLYCKFLPKVELHAHLNGSISNDTMHKLLERKRHRNPMEEIPELWKTTIKTGQNRTTEECFEMFKIIHQTVNDEEAVSTVACDVIKEFAADGVVYLELRSTPRANPKAGMTKASYIDAVIKGIQDALDFLLPSRMLVRILLSIDRSQSVAEAEDTVLLAEKYSKALHSDIKVVGVDLSGDPHAGDVAALLPVLKSIKEKNLKFAAHLSEIPSQSDETLLVLMEAVPNRIGHGTFMHPNIGGSEDIVKIVMDSKIPIEVCLSSNLKAGAVTSLDKHHMRFWMQNKHPVVLCTDDKGVFSTSLSEEYCLAATNFNLTKQDLWQLSLDAVNHIFEDDVTKAELRLLWHTK